MFDRKREPAKPWQKDHIGKAKSSGCVCCAIWVDGHGGHATGMDVEFNHHLHAGKRIDHHVGSAECLWHHRGILLPGFSDRSMREAYGPSRAKGSKPFRAVFGSDDELENATIERIRRYAH